MLLHDSILHHSVFRGGKLGNNFRRIAISSVDANLEIAYGST